MARTVNLVTVVAPGRSIKANVAGKSGLGSYLTEGTIVDIDNQAQLEQWGISAYDIQAFLKSGHLMEVPETSIPGLANAVNQAPVVDPLPATPGNGISENAVTSRPGRLPQPQPSQTNTPTTPQPQPQSNHPVQPFQYDPSTLRSAAEQGSLDLVKLNAMIKTGNPLAEPARDVESAISVLSQNFAGGEG